MTTAMERLEELLDCRDERIRALEAERDRRIFHDRWAWLRPSSSSDHESLEVPRLEIRWIKEDDYHWLATYQLVYREINGTVTLLPITVTRCSGGPDPMKEEEFRDGIPLPFRDGANIRFLMSQLNLPGYAILNDQVRKLP